MPETQHDWWDKKQSADPVLNEVNGGVTHTGDETVGEIWLLFDDQDVLTRRTQT